MDESSTDKEEITGLLNAYSRGDRAAMDKLMEITHQKLCRIARWRLQQERPNHTLQTGALVNEAYLELIEQRSVNWQNRAHFFRLAAFLMRRILMNHAREKKRLKRGGEDIKISLDEIEPGVTTQKGTDLLALDAALDKLAKRDKAQVEIVELLYFFGLTIEETAELLNVSDSTVKREWRVARAWLKRELKD